MQKVWGSPVYLGLAHCFHTKLLYRDKHRSITVLFTSPSPLI